MTITEFQNEKDDLECRISSFLSEQLNGFVSKVPVRIKHIDLLVETVTVLSTNGNSVKTSRVTVTNVQMKVDI